MINTVMFKQKAKKINSIKPWKLASVAIVTTVFAIASIALPAVQADRFQQEIDALNQSNAEKRNNLGALSVEAASLAEVIQKLQAEINALQAQIVENERKRDDTVAKIEAAEIELAKQRKLLGENIKKMYLEGQITDVEMVFSSKSMSDYVDKEQYRNTVKSKIKSSVDKVNALKAQLASEKALLEKLIADQQAMRSRVASQQAEQNRLLSLNQAQQNELDQQIKSNNSKISDLKKQQAAENARRFGFTSAPGSGPACGGGYPGAAQSRWGTWGCNYPLDYNVDNWGMYNRQCVSYTAFKVAASGRHMPYWGGIGNANQWPGNARRAGIPVDGNPRVGDVAISMSGYYGHAMYVEAVYGDGRILVSQYNYSWDGRYSEMVIGAGGLYFIHF